MDGSEGEQRTALGARGERSQGGRGRERRMMGADGPTT